MYSEPRHGSRLSMPIYAPSQAVISDLSDPPVIGLVYLYSYRYILPAFFPAKNVMSMCHSFCCPNRDVVRLSRLPRTYCTASSYVLVRPCRIVCTILPTSTLSSLFLFHLHFMPTLRFAFRIFAFGISKRKTSI